MKFNNKNNRLKIVFFLMSMLLLISKSASQANLTIVNNSSRDMTIKVMKGSHSYNELHEKVYISPWSSSTVYFSETGNYFTKSKAVLAGKSPVYRKGKPFYVTNDATGYSVLTLTFSIKESSVPVATGGVGISKQEFDKN